MNKQSFVGISLSRTVFPKILFFFKPTQYIMFYTYIFLSCYYKWSDYKTYEDWKKASEEYTLKTKMVVYE